MTDLETTIESTMAVVHYEDERWILANAYIGLIGTVVVSYLLWFLVWRMCYATADSIPKKLQFFAFATVICSLLYNILQWTARTDVFIPSELHGHKDCHIFYPIMMLLFWVQRGCVYLFFLARLRVSFAKSVYRISKVHYWSSVFFILIIVIPCVLFHEITDQPTVKYSRSGHHTCETLPHSDTATVYIAFSVADFIVFMYLIGLFIWKLYQLMNATKLAQMKSSGRQCTPELSRQMSRTRSLSKTRSGGVSKSKPDSKATESGTDPKDDGESKQNNDRSVIVVSVKSPSSDIDSKPSRERTNSDIKPRSHSNRRKKRKNRVRDGYKAQMKALRSVAIRSIVCGVVALVTTWSMTIVETVMHSLVLLMPIVTIINSCCVVFVFAISREMCLRFVCLPCRNMCQMDIEKELRSIVNTTNTQTRHLSVAAPSNLTAHTETTSGVGVEMQPGLHLVKASSNSSNTGTSTGSGSSSPAASSDEAFHSPPEPSPVVTP